MRTSRLGRFTVARVGYGAMQLTGPGVFGPPDDRDEAMTVLRTAVAAGVNHLDTAEYYGPTVVNTLIREALHPYPQDLVIVSKVGARRDETGGVLRYDEPDELRRGIEDNLRTLRVDQLAAVNLRLMDFAVPDARFDAQLAALIQARDEGLIDGIGLSNISLAHLRRALAVTEIVCVQNSFSLVDRGSAPILQACVQHEIAFVPYVPLGWLPATPRRDLRQSDGAAPCPALRCDSRADRPLLAGRPLAERAPDPRNRVRAASPGEHRCRSHRSRR